MAWKERDPGNILYMCPANERQRYNVTSSLIGWTHSQNDPWGHRLDLVLSTDDADQRDYQFNLGYITNSGPLLWTYETNFR